MQLPYILNQSELLPKSKFFIKRKIHLSLIKRNNNMTNLIIDCVLKDYLIYINRNSDNNVVDILNINNSILFFKR